MTLEIEYLLHFLEDEFGSHPDIRIHAVAPSSTKRAPDLVQDYDPESNELHLKTGVRVRVGSREYFFPAHWVKSSDHARIQAQATEIRALLDR